MAVAFGTVLADQLSKHVVRSCFEMNEVFVVAPFLNFTLSYNKGISFSMLSFSDDFQRWPLTALAAGVSILIFRWIQKTPTGNHILHIALGLILGGALGNLVDRVCLGHVTDFIQLHYGQWSFAIFNIADAAISIGVFLMIVRSIVFKDKSHPI